MEKLLAELKRVVRFKDSTDRGDLVLIVAKEPQVMVSYALVTDIVRDTSRRDEWWNVGLILLSIPPQEMTWTLRTSQLTGMEVFTMGGEERFVKAVDLGAISLQTPQELPVTVSQENKKRSFLKRVK
ncbi:MAG: hypothetical protein N2A40_08275 [Desulfobulbaceae bacterium]